MALAVTTFFIFKKRMNKKIIFLLVFSVVMLHLRSQEKSDSTEVTLNTLDVFGHNSQLKVGSGRLLTVINKATIKTMPVQTLDQLLESVTSVDVRQRGVGGTQSDISIRGGSFDQVMVLLNGVNVTDPQTGHYNLDIPVSLSDIARIELFQGSAARLFGVNAFGGVINIVTDDNTSNALTAGLSAGSFNTYTQNLSANLSGRKFSSYASVGHSSSKGYIPNTDYQITNVFSHSSLRTAEAGKFDLQLSYQQKSYGANAFYSFKYPSQFDHTQTFNGSLSWVKQIGSGVMNGQVYMRKHYDRFELYRDSIKNKPSWYLGHNYHLTDVTGAKLNAAFPVLAGKLFLGVELRNEHIYSNVLGHKLSKPVKNVFDDRQDFTFYDNRLNTTLTADYSKNFGELRFAAGASVSKVTGYDPFVNYGVDFSYPLSQNLVAFASVNSALRIPTFTDLYYKSATQIANPELKPERSVTPELGLKLNSNGFKASVSTFYRFGKNIIDWVKHPDSVKWENRNISKVNAFGADVNLEYHFSTGFFRKVEAGYSYLNLDKKSGVLDSKYALDYMQNKLLFSVTANIAKNLTSSVQATFNDRAGDYTDFVTNKKVNYKPYWMTSAGLNYSVSVFDLYVNATNILDVKYADFGGLTQPGVQFTAGVKVKID